MTGKIPYGYCHCGCGEKTNIATQNNRQYGHVRGQPVCYIRGHSGRKPRHPVNEDELPPGTRAILLTQGKYAIVDEEDYFWLSPYPWFAARDSNNWYARRFERLPSGERCNIHMHREIMNAPMGVDVDHIDGNGLNNVRSNLRLALHRENMRNTRLASNNSSGFRGVSWNKVCQKWQAYIRVDGKSTHLGLFTDVEEAAMAYDQAARELHGEFARPNFPDDQ